MRVPSLTAVALAASALLSPVLAGGPGHHHHDGHDDLPKRPKVEAHPFNTGQPMPPSPPRLPGRHCYVKAGCDPDDDAAPRILDAFKRCNHGGTVVLDQVYQVASPLDLTFLKHVDVVVTGEIHFKQDVYYWAENSFKFPFQNMSSFWLIGGEDVNIYGDLTNDQSVINGHGEAYWAEAMVNGTLKRPILFTFEGLHGGTMSNLRMRNSPNWFNIIANSSDIIVSDMDLEVFTVNSSVRIANSDGWDTYRSERIVIQDSVINNTDDCVSFKPNSTNVVIQNLVCDGSHGISVGSLGQYVNVTDIVEDLYVYNTSMSNASDAARIKVWPGIATDFQDNLNGGGGLGRVRNVTYDLFYQYNNERAITITQCYGQDNQTLCYEHPANLTIEDITMKNFWGVTSADYDPQAGTLICSAPDRCSNIRAENITITVPSGKTPEYECANLNESLLDFKCVDPEGDRDTGSG